MNQEKYNIMNQLNQMIKVAQACHLIWLEMNKDTTSKVVSSINEDFITPIYKEIQTTQDQSIGYDTIELSGIAYFFKDMLENDSETVVFENTMAYSLRGLDAVTVDKDGIYTIYEIKGTTRALKKPMRYLTKTKRRGRQLSLQWCWYSLTDWFDKPETANIFLTLYEDFLNGKIKRKLVVVESKKESDGSYTGVRSNYFDLTDENFDVDYSLDLPLGMLNEIKDQ